MYMFEIIDMYVGGGVRVYFKDRWNFIDCFSLISFIVYYALRIYIDNNPDGDNIVMWECSKLINCLNLFFIWFKVSWFL